MQNDTSFTKIENLDIATHVALKILNDIKAERLETEDVTLLHVSSNAFTGMSTECYFIVNITDGETFATIIDTCDGQGDCANIPLKSVDHFTELLEATL